MKEMKYQNKSSRELLHTGTYMNYNFFIMSMGAWVTAYVEVPKSSKLYGKNSSEKEVKNIKVHGGITYVGEHLNIGNKILRNSWFIGWDYAHAEDYIGLDFLSNYGGKKWTTKEVLEDVKNVCRQLKKDKNSMAVEIYLERELAIAELNNKKIKSIILKIKLWLIRRK